MGHAKSKTRGYSDYSGIHPTWRNTVVCVKAHVFLFCLAHMDEMYCIVVCSTVHKRPRRLTGNGGVLGNLKRCFIETAEIPTRDSFHFKNVVE